MKTIRSLALVLSFLLLLSFLSSCSVRFRGDDTTTPPATTTAPVAGIPGVSNTVTPYITSSETTDSGARQVTLTFYMEGEVHVAGFLMTITLPEGVRAEAEGRTMTTATVKDGTVTAVMAAPNAYRTRFAFLVLTLTYESEGAITLEESISEGFTVLEDGEIVPVPISHTSVLIP